MIKSIWFDKIVRVLKINWQIRPVIEDGATDDPQANSGMRWH